MLIWLIVLIGDVKDDTVYRNSIHILDKLAASMLNQCRQSKADLLADSMRVM